jgi:hypothetical protein
MGLVFEARDDRLDRLVAIKSRIRILPHGVEPCGTWGGKGSCERSS